MAGHDLIIQYRLCRQKLRDNAQDVSGVHRAANGQGGADKFYGRLFLGRQKRSSVKGNYVGRKSRCLTPDIKSRERAYLRYLARFEQEYAAWAIRLSDSGYYAAR